MRIWTSCFAVAGRNPNAVCIAVGKPRWWRGRNYPALAPTRAMLKMSSPDYLVEYNKILAALDPEQVVRDLGDGAIICCWERSGLCHRQYVACWLRERTKIFVAEWNPRTVEQLSLPFSQ